MIETELQRLQREVSSTSIKLFLRYIKALRHSARVDLEDAPATEMQMTQGRCRQLSDIIHDLSSNVSGAVRTHRTGAYK